MLKRKAGPPREHLTRPGRSQPRGHLGVDTLYPNETRDGAQTPQGHTPVQYGLTHDGIRVAIIDGPIDAYYAYRKWGFDAGLWQHTLCLDHERSTQMIVSYHAASQTERITTALPTVDWWRQVPACMSHLI